MIFTRKSSDSFFEKELEPDRTRSCFLQKERKNLLSEEGLKRDLFYFGTKKLFKFEQF